MTWGVYLDDNTGGVDVIGNIVARTYRGLLHLHNGRDNHVENNIFIDGKLQQMEFSGWTDKHRYWVRFQKDMIWNYESVIGEPVWRAMRHMDLNPRDAVLPDHTIMAGNEIVRNIICCNDPKMNYVNYRSFNYEHNKVDSNLVWHDGQPIAFDPKGKNSMAKNWAEWQSHGMDVHSVIADPMFVDAAKDDYRLKPDSPAFKLGFKPIPVDKIGPYQDELRATWPIVEAEGAREHPIVSKD